MNCSWDVRGWGQLTQVYSQQMRLLFFRNCSSTDASIIKQDYQYKISTATGVGKMKVTYLGLQFRPVVFSINEWLRIVQMNVTYPRTQFQHILKVILVINQGISIPSGLPGNFKVLLNKKNPKGKSQNIHKWEERYGSYIQLIFLAQYAARLYTTVSE